eukprot:1481666-Alexandrium_andersonii.AAC.1
MSASLVGSEMCIRDSSTPPGKPPGGGSAAFGSDPREEADSPLADPASPSDCLLYTSDAADDM